MYKHILIDIKLKNKFDVVCEKLFLDNNVSYEFVTGNPQTILQNTIYLTDNKNNVIDNCQTVFLINNDYDFLEIKNAICIKEITDIIKIYNNDKIVSWARELQFLAQNTLAYSKNKFDIERAERIREISCEMLSYKYDTSVKQIREIFANEVGYQTPKIENRAVIIKNNKILLVKEQADGKWALPGGYQDVDRTIRENVIKECYEEAGAVVNPKKIIALLNYNKHHTHSFPLGMLKVFVLCDYVSHNFENNIETEDVGFFSLEDIPELSENRTTLKQIKMCFDCYNNDKWEVMFD